MSNAQHSQLWGASGESWKQRLPDFSFAGYHFGEVQPPLVLQVADVKQFGAVGDGVHDDSEAFLQAIERTQHDAIFVPPGRYLIRQILWIHKPNLVIRGAGRDESVLVFDKPLQHIRPDMSATTTGQPTSNYSWAGGFIWIKGEVPDHDRQRITSEARRFERSFTVENPAALRVGQRVMVEVVDNGDRSLIQHIYCDDTGPIDKMRRNRTQIASRIAAIDGDRVTLERPLRFDLRAAWSPTLFTFAPTVSEVGVEDLGFEFPNVPYGGHFKELGYNAIAFNDCADCWCRNIRITNCDSGIYLNGFFCSASDILIDSVRPDFEGDNGHHGINLHQDCLCENFTLRTRFIHDFTVDHWACGNVVKNGRGVDLALDHHCDGPHFNLFTNVDAGAGTQLWRCGGGADLGKHTGGYATFWNIRARQPQSWPRERFGPPMMNLVGVQTNDPSHLDPDSRWFEAIDPTRLEPQDLHAAQLARRMQSHQPGK
jgi:hypothetical protein